MKTLKFSLGLVGLMLVPHFASATLVGPYTPDAHTLFLVHFDEAAGSSVATNVGSVGGNFITCTNSDSYGGLSGNLPIVTTLLGQSSYSGFGNAVSGINTDGLTNAVIGYDGNHDGSYTSDSGSGTPDAITMSTLNIGQGAGNSPFTLEALVKPSTITSTANQEILCTDNQNGGTRGFQFRINSSGKLEFNFIGQASSDFTFAIPTSGPNAFVPGNWYHAALTYDGTTLRFYWTKVDPTTTAANQIGQVAWTSTTADGAVTSPLIIGGENRGGEQEAFQGLIDEVRISSVARGPGGMEFTSPGVTIAQQPLSQNIDNYMPVTFTVSAASADTNLFYQWRFDSTPIPDATNASYTIASAQDTDEGFYDVVVTNSAGSSVISSNATLVVGAVNFLAHRWSFTNDLTDSIGGANGTSHGTLAVSGGALVLDGSSNCFMSLPPDLIKNSGALAVTFDFWATFGTNGANARVFDFGNTNFSGGLGILPPQNYVYFTPNTGAGTHTLAVAPGNQQSQISLTGSGALDGQTVHVTCVVDPPDGLMAIYTNGVLEASLTNFTTPLSSVDDQLCWVGRSLFTADAWLDARIDELRIFNGALSPQTVEQEDLTGPNVLPYDGPVKLVTEPSDAITVNGQPVTFTSSAIGHQRITYQWYENSSAILGATNADYSFTAASAQNGHTFYVAATNNILGTNYYAVSTNATLTIVTPQTLTWVGANGSSWDPTTLNWNNGTSLVAYGQYNKPVFSDLGIGQPTVNVTQAMYMVSLTANNSSGNYVIGSSTQGGSLNGLATLTKSGAGTLTVDLANNLSGGTLISGGTLQIGNADGSGTPGSGPITNNATLAFNRTNTVVAANTISGSGAVIQNGTGDLDLQGSNTFTGGLTVNNGRILMRDPNALGTGSTVVKAGGGIYLLGPAGGVLSPSSMTLNGSGPDGNGALHKGNGTSSTFGGAVTLAGDTTLNVDSGAVLNLTNASGISGSGFNLTLAGAGAGNISGPLALGSGSLTVSGGTWTVAPNNNYSGLSTISGGALRITGNGSIPIPGSPNSSLITLAGGALEVATNITFNDGNRGITVSPSGTITVDSNATFTVVNNISGSGSANLTKSGPGTLVLGGANSYLGFLYVDTASATADDGRVVIANNGALANLLALQGFPSIFIGNNNAGTSTLALDGSSGSINIAQDISLAGRNNAVPAIDNLAGNNTISGYFELAVGGSYVLQSDAGTLNIQQAWPYQPPGGVTTARTLILSGAGTITMSGGVQDGAFGTTNVPTAIIKTGSGVVNLPVANTYSGSTIVSNGVLSVTGSITGTNGVFVEGGALAGTGTINDNVTISDSSASGTIDALAVNGNCTISGPLTVDVNRTGLQSDKLTVSGGLSNSGSGSIVVNNLGTALQTGDRFVLFNKSVVNGASMTVSGGGVQWNNNLATDGSITVKSTMATMPTNIVVSVTNNNLTLSWPPSYQGWILQAQTNGLSTGLSTNWVDVAGSAAVTNETMTINPTNGTVFYRLRLPQ